MRVGFHPTYGISQASPGVPQPASWSSSWTAWGRVELGGLRRSSSHWPGSICLRRIDETLLLTFPKAWETHLTCIKNFFFLNVDLKASNLHKSPFLILPSVRGGQDFHNIQPSIPSTIPVPAISTHYRLKFPHWDGPSRGGNTLFDHPISAENHTWRDHTQRDSFWERKVWGEPITYKWCFKVNAASFNSK